MSNTITALYLKHFENRLDGCIELARRMIADADKENDSGLIDHSEDGFRDPENSPCIPALIPFEQLSTHLSNDIEKLID